MTGSSLRRRRFLGRPDDVEPGYVPEPHERPAIEIQPRVHAGRLWLVQAIAGGLLVLFLGVHLVAQHLLVPGGLRSFADVTAYLRQPIAFAAEIGLLLSVLVHAGLGVRGTLVDVVRDPRWLTRIGWVIAAIATGIFVYAIWLTLRIIGAL